jgi:hypothetical protein
MNPSTGIPLPSFRCARWQTGLKPSATYSLATRTFITGSPVVLACRDGQKHAT